MKHRDEVAIGDPVEVERVVRQLPVVTIRTTEPPATLEPITREWVPGTVAFVGRDQIGVAFSDGERQAIARHSLAWRFASWAR